MLGADVVVAELERLGERRLERLLVPQEGVGPLVELLLHARRLGELAEWLVGQVPDSGDQVVEADEGFRFGRPPIMN